jgi:hypothetical protein
VGDAERLELYALRFQRTTAVGLAVNAFPMVAACAERQGLYTLDGRCKACGEPIVWQYTFCATHEILDAIRQLDAGVAAAPAA